MIKDNSHFCNYRIYYEDTDSGGVVYYANYLKFAERARTEMLRELGISQIKLQEEQNVIFVVRKADMEFIRPARLDDEITIKTSITETKAAQIIMHQEISFEKKTLCIINVSIVSITTNFKPVRIPQNVAEKMTKLETN